MLLIATFWMALPLRLSSSPSAVSNQRCLTLADAEPQAGGSNVAVLRQCAALYPDDLELLVDLGSAYEATGQLQQAEDAYQRAAAGDPGDGDVRLRLGRLLLRRGAIEDARRQAEAGLLVQPNRLALVDLLEATRSATPARFK